MYETNDSLDCDISDANVIWRYVDLPKYIALLTYRSLWFSQLQLFGDKFEGTYTRKDREMITIALDELKEKARENTLPGVNIADEKEQKAWFFLADIFPQFHQEMLATSYYVNCWHASKIESVAMWAVYVKNTEGIAIRSTTKRLAESVSQSEFPVHIGAVEYIDYEQDRFKVEKIHIDSPVLHRRRNFAYEQEIRAYVNGFKHWRSNPETVKFDELPPGIPVKVDLNTLIDAVYVAPSSAGWFHPLVEDVNRTYGVTAKVHRSSLVSDPIV